MLKSNKGFSLIELITVLIIVGLLAYLAVGHYAHVFEKARADGAKQALWEIRVAWGQYAMNSRDDNIILSDLNLTDDTAPSDCSRETYYRYRLNSTHAIATRCINKSSKQPKGRIAYNVTINLENGTWGGTKGYY